MLVSPVSIHKGDMGSVIVGGRELSKRSPEESVKRFVYMYTCVCFAYVKVCILSVCRMRRGVKPEKGDELVRMYFCSPQPLFTFNYCD